MATANTTQVNVRWYADDNADPDAMTPLAAQNASVTRGTGTGNRLVGRVLIQNDNSANWNQQTQFQYQNVTQATGWQTLNTTSSHVQATTGTPTNGTACDTSILTGGTGTFETDGSYTDTGAPSQAALAKNNYQEYAVCLYVVDADVASGDEIEVRLQSSELATWTNVLSLTVAAAATDSEIAHDASVNVEVPGEISHAASVNIGIPIQFNETFEGTGWVETYSDTAVESGTSTVDPDYAVSSVTGAPSSGWDAQCLEIVHNGGENAYRVNDLGSGNGYPISYTRVEFVVASGPTGGNAAVFFWGYTANASTGVWQLRLDDNAGQLRIGADIRHDGNPNFYWADIDVDTPYCVEFYWDSTNDLWSWRLNETTQNSGSLTSTATTIELERTDIGSGSGQNGDYIAYLDNYTINTETWPGQTFTSSTPSEIAHDASVNVVVPGEISHAASVNVECVGQVSHAASVSVGLQSYIEEYFEDATDYDYSGWTAQTNGSGTLDPNAATSTVTGAPLNWSDECLKSTYLASGDYCRLQETFAVEIPSVYHGFDFIVESYTAAEGSYLGLCDAYSPSYADELFHCDLFETAGGLTMQVAVWHDGTSNTWSHAVALDTRYRVEFEWDLGAQAWSYRLNGVVQQSGSLTGTATAAPLGIIFAGITGGSFTDAVVYQDNVTLGGEDWIAPAYNGQISHAASVRISTVTPQSEIAHDASVNIEVPSEVSAPASATVALPGQDSYDASVDVALASDTYAAASINIKVAAPDIGAYEFTGTHAEISHAASANISVHSQTQTTASVNVGQRSETFSDASVRIEFVGQTAYDASATVKVAGESSAPASVNVTGTTLGQASATASTNIASLSAVYDDASVRIALRGESSSDVSVDIALRGQVATTASTAIERLSQVFTTATVNIVSTVESEVSHLASVDVALQGQTQATTSTNIALRSSFSEAASTDIALQSQTANSASVAIALRSQVFSDASVRIEFVGQIVHDASVNVEVGSEVAYAASLNTTGKLVSEASAPASVRIQGSSAVVDDASATISVRSVSAADASVAVALKGAQASDASINIATGADGRAYSDASVAIALFGQQSSVASMAIGLQSSTASDASIRVSRAASVDSVGSVLVSLYGQATDAASLNLALQSSTDNDASVAVKTQGDTSVSASLNVTGRLESQAAADGSVRIELRSAVVDEASVYVGFAGRIQYDGSVAVALYGRTAEVASIAIERLSETQSLGSVAIARKSQQSHAASANIAIQGQSSAAGSIEIARPAQHQSVGSVTLEVAGVVQTDASVRVAFRGAVAHDASISIGNAGRTTATASIYISALRITVVEPTTVTLEPSASTVVLTESHTTVSLQGMDDTFEIKQNDTAPNLRATLYSGDGTAVNLVGANVKFIMRLKGATTPKVNALAAIVDSPNGVVEYDWSAGDTDTPSSLWIGEFEVTDQSGNVITFPNGSNEYIPIIITDDLG